MSFICSNIVGRAVGSRPYRLGYQAGVEVANQAALETFKNADLLKAFESILNLIEINPYTRFSLKVVKWTTIGFVSTAVSEKVYHYILDLLKNRDAKIIAFELISQSLNEKLRSKNISLDQYRFYLDRISKAVDAVELTKIYEMLISS